MERSDKKHDDGLVTVIGKDNSISISSISISSSSSSITKDAGGDPFAPRRRAWWRRKRWPLVAAAFVALLVSLRHSIYWVFFLISFRSLLSSHSVCAAAASPARLSSRQPFRRPPR
jgi:hypothetical protein